MMKINFLWIASVAIILLLFHSCRTEATTESDSDLENGASYKTVKLKDVAEFKNLIISNPYLLGHQYGIVAEDTMDLLNIDTEEMNSYSLQISPKNDSAFYIVILSYDKQKNNKVSKLVGKFVSDKNGGNKNLKTFTGKSYFTTIAGTEVVSSVWKNGKVIHNEPSMSNKGCNVTYSVVGSMCSEGLHYPWDAGACQASGKPFWTISSSTQCDQEVIDPNWGGGGFGDIGGGGGIKFQPFLLPANELAIFNNLPLEVQYGIKNYYHGSNEYTNEEYQFVLWTINFFGQNPNTTWTQFESWFINKRLDYTNSDEVALASNIVGIIHEFTNAKSTNSVSSLSNNPKWKQAWEAFKNSFLNPTLRNKSIALVKATNILLEEFYKYGIGNLEKNAINTQIFLLKTAVQTAGFVNTNPSTMTWNDVVYCWLLEMGDFPVNTTAGYGNLPTIGFSGNDYVISGKPGAQMRYLRHHLMYMNGSVDPTSVIGLRNEAINQIKNNDFSNVYGNWGFGLSEILSTTTLQDGLQFCLGSYVTTVYITPKGNKQYELTFVIKNQTGWTSGTRWLNDQDNNPNNDSVLDDKPRGEGIHLGGTIAETFGWKETITVP